MAPATPPDEIDVDAELQELYALDPADFVATRTALVRRLRAAKRRDDANEVAQRRRPSPPAWALDRVARERPDLVERALVAGARLREASEAAVAGDAGALRTATADDRAAREAVVAEAVAQLGERGAAARAQLTATVRAAVLDEDLAAEWRAGILATDHESPGFGWAGFDTPADVPLGPPPALSATKPKRAAGSRRRTVVEQEAISESAQTEPDKADAERDRAEEERRARAEVDAERDRAEEERRARVEAEVGRLEGRAAELAEAAERAEAAARQARAEARRAQADAETATEQADQARIEADAAAGAARAARDQLDRLAPP